MHKTKISFCNIVILFETVIKFQLSNIFSSMLFLDLGIFSSLSTYEINHKLGYTYVNYMLKFSRTSKTSKMLSWNFECYKSKFWEM